jgi:hypothetical protein
MDYLIGILLGRFFNVGPRVRKLSGALMADTAVPIAVLTLGLKLRRVMRFRGWLRDGLVSRRHHPARLCALRHHNGARHSAVVYAPRPQRPFPL